MRLIALFIAGSLILFYWIVVILFGLLLWIVCGLCWLWLYFKDHERRTYAGRHF